jgi:hypothetical protein
MINKFQLIIEELQKDSFFKQFKYRKKDSAFFKKNNDGFMLIQFQHWSGYDLNRDTIALVLKPLYTKRFDVLHKWQDKFSFKSKADQNNNYSIIFSGQYFSNREEYFFLNDGSDLVFTADIMRKDIINNSIKFESEFSTLQSLCDFQIVPILEGRKELPNIGADWVFEYLILCSIIKPDNYSELKQKILIQVDKMNQRGEPNIIEYYSNLNNILLQIFKSHN